MRKAESDLHRFPSAHTEVGIISLDGIGFVGLDPQSHQIIKKALPVPDKTAPPNPFVGQGGHQIVPIGKIEEGMYTFTAKMDIFPHIYIDDGTSAQLIDALSNVNNREIKMRIVQDLLDAYPKTEFIPKKGLSFTIRNNMAVLWINHDNSIFIDDGLTHSLPYKIDGTWNQPYKDKPFSLDLRSRPYIFKVESNIVTFPQSKVSFQFISGLKFRPDDLEITSERKTLPPVLTEYIEHNLRDRGANNLDYEFVKHFVDPFCVVRAKPA